MALGAAIHECGGARMGNDPATSVLNSLNQCWDAKKCVPYGQQLLRDQRDMRSHAHHHGAYDKSLRVHREGIRQERGAFKRRVTLGWLSQHVQGGRRLGSRWMC
jgi:hypothetical protein